MSRALLCVFAILLAGCGLSADVLDAIKTTNDAVVLAEPFTEAAYKAKVAKCVLDAKSEAEGSSCIDAAEQEWKSYVETMERVREIRCSIEPAKCPTPEKRAPAAPSSTSDTTTVTVTERP
jgi:hypothetical protein